MDQALAKQLGAVRRSVQPCSIYWAVGLGVVAPASLAFLAMAASFFVTASVGQAVETPGRIEGRLRLVSFGLLCIAATAWILRKPLADLLRGAVESTPALRQATSRGLAAALGLGEWPAAACLLIVYLAGSAVRLAYVHQPMRYDEAYTFNEFASHSMWMALTSYTFPNNHVLHTLLVHLAYRIFGDAPEAIRLPALLAGLMMMPATYLFARVLYGRGAALLATALVAGSSILVEYSTNARGYTLVTLALVLGLALLVYAQRRDNAAALLAFALLGVIGFFVVPTMLYGFATALVWYTLMATGAGEQLRTVLLRVGSLVLVTALLVLVAYAPLVVISGPSALLGNRFVTPLSIRDFASAIVSAPFSLWEQWVRGVPGVAAVGLALAVVAGTVQHRWLSRLPGPPPMVVLVGCCTILLVGQRVVPYNRVWLMFLPLFCTVASGGAVAMARLVGANPRPWLSSLLATATGVTLAALVLNSGAVLQSKETGVFPDAEAVTLFLRDQTDRQEPVVSAISGSYPELEYYFRRLGVDERRLSPGPFEQTTIRLIIGSAQIQDIESVLTQRGLAAYWIDKSVATATFPGSVVYTLRLP
jgi:hypothetical protein